MIVATSASTGGSKCPPDTCIQMGSIPFIYTELSRIPGWGCGIIGAADRNRTGTDFTPRDFKSLVSTYSTTAAYLFLLLYPIENCRAVSTYSPVWGARYLPCRQAAASSIDHGTRCALAYSATGGAQARGHSGGALL